jgi:hypothetical protein
VGTPMPMAGTSAMGSSSYLLVLTALPSLQVSTSLTLLRWVMCQSKQLEHNKQSRAGLRSIPSLKLFMYLLFAAIPSAPLQGDCGADRGVHRKVDGGTAEP